MNTQDLIVATLLAAKQRLRRLEGLAKDARAAAHQIDDPVHAKQYLQDAAAFEERAARLHEKIESGQLPDADDLE
jgi:hypothetical protein